MFYTFEDRVPNILADNYFVAESADVIGSVTIHNNVCVLSHAVIRADNATIDIGENSNIQDGVILHTDSDIPMQIGKSVTIGHRAMLHGCQIGDNSVIGIGAVILNHANIGKNCLIGANALVLENQVIPDNSFVVGSPAKVKAQLSAQQLERLREFAPHYVVKIAKFNNSLKEFHVG